MFLIERYTSEANCISDDVKSIQVCSKHFLELRGASACLSASKRVDNAIDNPDLTNAFNGKRVKNGLFLDVVINKVFNADINAAVNHIKVGTGKCFAWLKDKLFKLCNPIKIKSDYEFCRLLKSLGIVWGISMGHLAKRRRNLTDWWKCQFLLDVS